jgi:transposase
VLKATGDLEIIVAPAIAAASLPLAVVNPAQIRAFACAVGRLAKTDRPDAELIARFAEQVRPSRGRCSPRRPGPWPSWSPSGARSSR